MLTYQQAGHEDIEAIYLLNKENMDLYEDLDSLDYDFVLDYLYHDIEQAIAQYHVIYRNNIKVGYYCLHEDENEIELVDLYILKDFRHQGLGTQVLNKIIQEASKPISLYAFSQNKRAIDMYLNHGFTIAKRLGPTRIKLKRTL